MLILAIGRIFIILGRSIKLRISSEKRITIRMILEKSRSTKACSQRKKLATIHIKTHSVKTRFLHALFFSKGLSFMPPKKYSLGKYKRN
jgi:hypothetical protein